MEFVTSRLYHVAKIPEEIADAGERVLRTASGVIYTASSVATLGAVDTLNDDARWINSSRRILPSIFQRVLYIVNPRAEVSAVKECDDFSCAGWVYSHCYPNLAERENENFWMKHVVTRAQILGEGLLEVIASVVDVALGLVAAIGAIILCGTNQNLNDFANLNLHLVILPELATMLRGTVNPYQSHLS